MKRSSLHPLRNLCNLCNLWIQPPFPPAELPAICGPSGGAEDAVDDGFLGLPEEGHREGDGDEGEHHEQPVSGFAEFREEGEHEDGHPVGPGLGEGFGEDEDAKEPDEAAVDLGEEAGVGSEDFVGKHGGEPDEDAIEAHHEADSAEDHEADALGEEPFGGMDAPPVGEGDEGEEEAVEDGGAVEGAHPDAFLRLEAGEAAESVEEEGEGGSGREAGLEEVEGETAPTLIAPEGSSPASESAPGITHGGLDAGE